MLKTGANDVRTDNWEGSTIKLTHGVLFATRVVVIVRMSVLRGSCYCAGPAVLRISVCLDLQPGLGGLIYLQFTHFLVSDQTR